MSGSDFKLKCVEVAVKISQSLGQTLSLQEIFEIADKVESYCSEFVGNK